jgi:hypothetical protein
MTATCNGKDILSLTLSEPRIGVWSAVVDVDSEQAITGSVEIVVDGVTFTGTVVKGDLHAGRVHAQIAGGAGKISKVLDTKHYRGTSLGTVVDDLMRETGEKLSPTTDARVRGHIVSRWSRFRGMASAELELVAAELKLTWRILRDGTVWLGEDTWAEARGDHDEIDRTPGRDSVLIAPEAPHVQPGQTFDGKRVSRVSTATLDGGGLRQEILFESAAGGSRVTEDLLAIIDKRTAQKIACSRLYPARIVRQSGDGTLELLPDDPVIRGNGLTGVPIRSGIPGVTVKVLPGSKVNLFFEGGDTKLPAAALWSDGSSVISAEITLTSELKITAPTVTLSAATVTVDGMLNVAGEVTAHYNTLPSHVSLHTHPTPVGLSGPPTPGS